MIQITKKITAPVPDILQKIGINETQGNCELYESGVSEFEFKSSIYGHTEVKSALIELQAGKCCFCESQVTHIDYGDVEHFRPKKGWVQADEPLNKPGYYWLAYQWGNLLLSCKICNQRFKKNFFPLEDDNTRALSHHSNLNNEQPMFIDPVNDNPDIHIEFKEEIPFGRTNKGKITIDALGIDRETLNERRRKALQIMKSLYKIAKGIPIDGPNKEDAVNEVKKIYELVVHEEFEYSAMYKSFFSKNPIEGL